MRRALLLSLAIVFAIACGDNITEPMPERTQAVAPPVSFATTTTEDGLSISTDKDDYQPGDVVHLTGSGWEPGDVLDIVLTDDPMTHEPHRWTVTVGEDGTFHDQTYVVDQGDLDVKFTLVATSRATGRSLTVNFTDSQPQSVTLSPNTRSLAEGVVGSATYDVLVRMVGNSDPCTVTLSISTPLPLGATASFSGGASITTNADFTKTLTITTTSGTPASTTNFTVQAARGANCQGNGVTNGNGTLVVFGPAAKLAFSQQPPATTQAGASFSTTVQVLDAGDRLIANSTVLIDLAIANNPGGGTLSGIASRNAVGGVATFPGLSINKAGSGYTLRATSGSLTEAVSSGFTITSGPATKLAFKTQPGNGAPGNPISPQPEVSILDANDNLTGAASAVTLSILTGTGAPGAELTCSPSNSKAAVSGVASFAGCAINLAGNNYQLRATSGSLTAVNSTTFNIVANNLAPVLAGIGDKTIAEETQLSFTATATDENVASLSFSLANPASGDFPTGAAITTGGAFTWTPTEAQGPGTYRVKVVVTDNATLTDEEEIGISVTEVNRAPVVTTIPDKTVNEEAALSFTAAATDPDLPANAISFSLLAGADPVPAGASIDASSGEFTWTPTEAQGPGVYEFKVRATDDGSPVLFGETGLKVTVNEVNKAPVLEAIGDQIVNEGSELTFDATAADPDIPPNTLTFSLDGAPVGATIDATTGAFSWTPADDDPTGTPSDDNTFKVVVTDNGSPQMSDEETITVTVKNVGPVVDVGDDKTGDEGATIPLEGEFTDPGADSHTWSWEYVEGFNGSATCTITGATTDLTPTISCTDDGVVKVTLTVRDDDTGEGSDDLLLTLENVAPSATALNTNSPVNEGSAITLSLAGVTDPSSVDFASLEYAFDCGTGTYGAFGSSNTASCPTNDNGSRNVRGKVRDKDGGVSADYTAVVTINNVAPTATALSTNSPVEEGSDITLTLAGATDVSSVDATTLHFAFDCGSGYGTATSYATTGTANAATCATTDNGTRSVRGKVFDKDGDSNEYTASVTITNVKPTIVSLTKPDGTPLPGSIFIGGTVAIKVNFTDPGTDDTHTSQIDCGTGYTSVNGGANVSTGFETSCTFATIGSKDIKVTVTDDDGGVSDEKKHTILVTYNFSGFFAPVDRPNMMNISKAGQSIPLKWRLTDASGRGIPGVTGVLVQAYGISCSLGSNTDIMEEYAAGASGLQDLGDGYYQFNWKTPGSYLGTCKSIALTFGTGGIGYTEKPSAFFTFKK